MKKGFLLPLVAVVALTAVTAASSKTSGPSSSAAPSASGSALVKCGKQVTIGLSGPITGPAASLGKPQIDWGQYFRTTWNKTHKLKVKYVLGDTQLPNVAEATKVAQTFASTANMLGVVGPAGSQEVEASAPIYKSAGMGYVSGSATRTTLTDGSRKGYFFRVVPTDAQQGPTVARYAVNKLKIKKVMIIDDQEAYSTGLADDATKGFEALGATVSRDSVSQSASDFSSLISRIGSDIQAVYIPWQLPPKAQLFAQQMREQGKKQTLLSSDGTFDPSTYKPTQAAYASFFPIDTKNPVFGGFKNAHGGDAEFFGAPTYVAAQVVTAAVVKACGNGNASRAEVRRNLAAILIPTSLLGFPVKFTPNGALANPGNFGIYKVSGAVYTRVG